MRKQLLRGLVITIVFSATFSRAVDIAVSGAVPGTAPGAVAGAAVDDGTIIYVSRKLRMSKAEPAFSKDFYVDLGERQGLKLGAVLEVFRTLPVLNGVVGDANNFVRIRLGELKVFFLGEYSSIARLQSEADKSELPVLDYPTFMIGDTVALKTSLPFDGSNP